MEIIHEVKNKDKYMDLLLLADEQEDMIKKYLYRGELFALYDGDLKTVAVVSEEMQGVFEIKNLATYEKYQRKGYASHMINYIIDYVKQKGRQLLLGTGECEKILGFYQKFGFSYSHRIENFFIDNYDHEMYEDGTLLRDMIYLKIDLENNSSK